MYGILGKILQKLKVNDMKKVMIPLVIIVLGFFGCNNPSSKSNGTINLSDTLGYFAAKNMKGLGSFKIGESTRSEILNIIKEEIRKDSRRYKETNYKELPLYSGYEPKYLDYKFDKKGNIASEFYREDFGSIFNEIKYDTISSFLKEDILKREVFGCPNIRELEMFKYYIGDIEISSLNLKFYKDTLYQIACSQNDKIEEGFKAKYGSGKTIDNTVKKGDKLLKIDKNTIWENETVRAESQTYIECKYDGDKYQGAGYSNCFFNMNSKNEKKLSEITDCKNAANETKKRFEEQNKKKDINQL
jgi:hypothetical protein